MGTRLTTYEGSKISKAPEDSVAVLFHAFGMKEGAEGRLHGGGRKQGGDQISEELRLHALLRVGGQALEGRV